ncbi:hypothetical protein MKX01_019924 [Papaver californicum]|nr:hypothetical protein MKX01_019924 [Papaver californicum]
MNQGRISAPIPAIPIVQNPSVSLPQAQVNFKKRRLLSSSSSGFPRIGRMRYCTATSNNISITTSPKQTNSSKFRRLRLAHQDWCLTRTNQGARAPCPNVADISDAMSEKIWTSVRRSHRLHDKDYAFREDSPCASSGDFAPGFNGNKKSSGSDSSKNVSRTEAESSEGISSGGPPSPFPGPNTVQSLFGREVMRGNDFSNTVYMDNISPGDNEMFTSHSDLTPPGCKEATCDKGKGVIQSDSPPDSLIFRCFLILGCWVVARLTPVWEMNALEYVGPLQSLTWMQMESNISLHFRLLIDPQTSLITASC